jgi:NAD(P)-dependent dehydrogenase (short-subunit alcohol dehydrogenase family)
VLETLRLDGNSAVVTGSGRGLGKAMAKALAQAGAAVVCAARTPEQIAVTVFVHLTPRTHRAARLRVNLCVPMSCGLI